MNSHPDQEVVMASELGGDSITPSGCPGEDSSPRESIALDSERRKLIQNESPSRGLAEQENVDKLVLASESTVLDDADESVVELDKFPEPYFLRRVLLTQWSEIEGVDFRLLAVTVHAVMLESGFIRIHPATCLPLRHVCISGSFPKEPFAALSLRYSLPEILTGGIAETFRGVVLKLQSLGHFLIVYGSLMPSNPVVRGVCLNMRTFGRKIRLMMNFLNENGITSASSTPATCSYREKVAFILWKTLKEDLVLPLLIDLSDKAGLRVPSTFLTLRTELKLYILERLNVVELAKVACVCSDFRQLSSNGDLWKKMYTDEFIELPLSHGTVTDWKQTFARSWLRARRRKRIRRDVLYSTLGMDSPCPSDHT